jgi:hypothetical protein
MLVVIKGLPKQLMTTKGRAGVSTLINACKAIITCCLKEKLALNFPFFVTRVQSDLYSVIVDFVTKISLNRNRWLRWLTDLKDYFLESMKHLINAFFIIIRS